MAANLAYCPGVFFPADVNAVLDSLLVAVVMCHDDRDGYGCGRPVGEFKALSETLGVLGVAFCLGRAPRCAVRRYACPCGKEWEVFTPFDPWKLAADTEDDPEPFDARRYRFSNPPTDAELIREQESQQRFAELLSRIGRVGLTSGG